jgi:hypothetical protein
LVFDLILLVAACLLVTSPLTFHKARILIDKLVDFIERRQFERMVDRVGGR